MNTTKQQMTGAEIIEAVRAGTMTQDEVVAILMERMSADRMAPRVISFGKAPKDGWKESDRVQK